MAEFLTAVQWVRLLLAQFRQRSSLNETNRAGAIVQRDTERCAGCRYYVATHGACHALPPVQRRGDNHHWPAVQPGDWCGAFSPAFGGEA